MPDVYIAIAQWWDGDTGELGGQSVRGIYRTEAEATASGEPRQDYESTDVQPVTLPDWLQIVDA